MFTRLKYYFRLTLSQKHPLRFVLGYFLKRTGLCRLITFRVHNYKLHFFPTALSFSFFANPFERANDVYYLSRLLNEGDSFVDVGANIGALTIAGAKVVSQKGQVFSFEAHPMTMHYLRKNLALNNINFVQTFENAVGDQPGTLSFSDDVTDDQNRVSDDGRLLVEVVRLDQTLPSDLIIHFLKIDTEGFELPVLKSCDSIFQNIQLIYFESDERHCSLYGYSTSDLVDYLLDKDMFVIRVKNGFYRMLDYGYVSPTRENLFGIRNLHSFVEMLGLKQDDTIFQKTV